MKDDDENDEKITTVAITGIKEEELQMKAEKLSEKYVEGVVETEVKKEEGEVTEELALLEGEEKWEKIDDQKIKIEEEQQVINEPSVDVISEENGKFEQKELTDNEVKEELVSSIAETEEEVKESDNKIEDKEVIQSDTPPKVDVVQKIEEDIVVVDEPKPKSEKESETELATAKLPKGTRWSISAPHIDLTANWKIVVNDQFKEDYDKYLKNLGQPALVRSIAVSIVELTTEEIIQGDQGRTLCIKGKNLRGVWERTLLSSGSDGDNGFDENSQEHDQIDLITADKEKVKAEAWWEEEGTVHRSFLRGVKKYGGGDFESRRYLEDDGQTLVCESMFHPNDGEGKATVKWTFTRLQK